MEYDEIESALLDFLRSDIFDKSAKLKADSNLIAAGLDSLSLLRVLVFIENNFGLRIPESEINEERMCSVRNMAGLVDELRQNT